MSRAPPPRRESRRAALHMPMEDGCEVRHCIACAQVFRGKGQNARFLNPNARFLILNPRNRQWCVRAHARPRNCSGIDGGSGEAAAAAGVCRSARRAARAWRSLNGSARAWRSLANNLGAALLLSSTCDDHVGTRAEWAAAACNATAAASRNTADRSVRCFSRRNMAPGKKPW
jgi:hypothetical protein